MRRACSVAVRPAEEATPGDRTFRVVGEEGSALFAIVDPRSAGAQARAGQAETGTIDTPAAHDGGSARPAVDPADPAAPLTNRRVAQAYVASVCFKHGPPRLLGTELEWLVRDADRPARRLDPAALRRALGPYAPPTLFPAGTDQAPAPEPTPLPSGGTVTVEPGGQVEIASPPMPSLAALLVAVEADAAVIRDRLATENLVLLRRAGDPLRAPRRVLDVPRYAAMEAAFDRIGPHGRTMMCSTSAVQVCLDAGEGAQVAQRWAALHELGPVLLGAFANSPAVHGRRTGWKSSRMATWLALDPERTRPPAVTGTDPATEYAERALATRLLVRRRATGDAGGGWSLTRSVPFGEWVDGDRVDGDEPPTAADLAYHLTTLFPPVRPQGHLEVRYLDQQPGDEWMVPIAIVAALFADDATVDRARAAAAPAVGRWAAAARHGLDDRVLRRAAGEVFELAHRRLAAFGDLPPHARDLVEHAVDRVLRGRCPADEPVGEPGEDELGPPAAPWVSMSPPDPHTAPHPDTVRGGAPS